jgi:hypothetical protein
VIFLLTGAGELEEVPAGRDARLTAISEKISGGVPIEDLILVDDLEGSLLFSQETLA